MAVRAEDSSTMVLSAAHAAAVGGGDGVGDQVMLQASRFPEVLPEPDGDAGFGEARGDAQDGLLRR
jgi:hypothetical protein